MIVDDVKMDSFLETCMRDGTQKGDVETLKSVIKTLLDKIYADDYVPDDLRLNVMVEMAAFVLSDEWGNISE